MALFEYRKIVPGAGFEPAKHYAEDLESTPFDRSGTPAYVTRVEHFILDYSSSKGRPFCARFSRSNRF